MRRRLAPPSTSPRISSVCVGWLSLNRYKYSKPWICLSVHPNAHADSQETIRNHKKHVCFVFAFRFTLRACGLDRDTGSGRGAQHSQGEGHHHIGPSRPTMTKDQDYVPDLSGTKWDEMGRMLVEICCYESDSSHVRGMFLASCS